MTPVVILLSSLAHGDVLAHPPQDTQFAVHEVYLDNVQDFPDLVFVAMEDRDPMRSPKTFTADTPTQEMGRGHGRGTKGLHQPRVVAMKKADHDAWKTEAQAAAEAQREACFERGEGCVHPSRFEARYPRPERSVPCSEPIAVQTTVPLDAPPVRTDAFRIVRAGATECVLEPIPVPPAAPEHEATAPPASAADPSGTPPPNEAPTGCSSTAGAWTSLGSLVGGLSLLLLIGRRRA